MTSRGNGRAGGAAGDGDGLKQANWRAPGVLAAFIIQVAKSHKKNEGKQKSERQKDSALYEDIATALNSAPIFLYTKEISAKNMQNRMNTMLKSAEATEDAMTLVRDSSLEDSEKQEFLTSLAYMQSLKGGDARAAKKNQKKRQHEEQNNERQQAAKVVSVAGGGVDVGAKRPAGGEGEGHEDDNDHDDDDDDTNTPAPPRKKTKGKAKVQTRGDARARPVVVRDLDDDLLGALKGLAHQQPQPGGTDQDMRQLLAQQRQMMQQMQQQQQLMMHLMSGAGNNFAPVSTPSQGLGYGYGGGSSSSGSSSSSNGSRLPVMPTPAPLVPASPASGAFSSSLSVGGAFAGPDDGDRQRLLSAEPSTLSAPERARQAQLMRDLDYRNNV